MKAADILTRHGDVDAQNGSATFISENNKRHHHIFLLHDECVKMAKRSSWTNTHVCSLAQFYQALEHQYWRFGGVHLRMIWPHRYYGASPYQQIQWNQVSGTVVQSLE